MVIFARSLCKTDENLMNARGRTLMSVDQAASSPPSVSETSITFVAKAYFSPGELAEARRLYKESGSYAEAIAYLVGCGEDLRRRQSAYPSTWTRRGFPGLSLHPPGGTGTPRFSRSPTSS